MIKGQVQSGLGLARQLGYPTVNLYQESYNCGVFVIDDKNHGPGIAFVMPRLTEIHFLSSVHGPILEIEAEIVDWIDPPENGILDYFYKGLACDRDSSSGT
jgi:FAD synthase